MSVVKKRSVSPSTLSHSVFALISLTGSKHNPVVLQKSKTSVCHKTSSPSPHPWEHGWRCSCLTPCLLAPGARSKEHTWHLNGMQRGLRWLLDPVRACPAALSQLSQGFSLCTQLGPAARTCCTCQPVNKCVLPHCWEQENSHRAWIFMRKHVLKAKSGRTAIQLFLRVAAGGVSQGHRKGKDERLRNSKHRQKGHKTDQQFPVTGGV